MLFVLPVIALLLIFGIRLQKPEDRSSVYLEKVSTFPVRGIFIILIVMASYMSTLGPGALNDFDRPLYNLFGLYGYGQLLYAPLFFYSGYGIFQKFITKGKKYAQHIPLQQILRHYLSFFIVWIIFVIINLAYKSNYSLEVYLKSSIGLDTIGNSAWYVMVMLIMYFISFISFRVADKKTAVVINLVGAIFVAFGMRALGSPSYVTNPLFVYFFGIWYAYLKDRIDAKVEKRPYLRYVTLLGSAALFVGFHFYYLNVPYTENKELLLIIPMLLICIFIVSFTSIFKIRSKILHFFGANAFWIYLLHLLPILLFKRISFITEYKYVYFAVSFVVTIGLAFVMNKVFNYFWDIFAKHHGNASEESNVKLGIVISYITLFVSIIGAFVVTPRVLENLGDAQYGLLSFANSITAWLTVISSALAASYIKFASDRHKEGKDEGLVNRSYIKIFGILAGIMLLIIGVGVGLFFAFDIKLPQYSWEENRLILSLLLISGVNVALNVLFSVFNNFLTYRKQFIFIRIVALAVSFLTFACNLIFSFLTKNVLSISIAAVCITTVSSAITILYAFKKEKMTFARSSDRKETSSLIKAIITFSSFILLNAVVDQINVNLDKTILGIMVNAEAVTDYTLAKYFNAYLLTLSVAISSTFVPKIHELVANNKKEELNALYLKVSTSQMAVMFLVGGGFFAVGKEFMGLWLGMEKEYIYYYALIPIALDMVALSYNTCIEIQRAMNKHKFRAFLYIGLALVNVALSVVLIKVLPKGYEIWGAFIGTAFSVVVGNWIILNIYNKVKIGLPIGKLAFNLFKHALYAGVGVAVALVMRRFLPNSMALTLRFISQGFAFVIIYFGLLLVFERKTAIPMFKKVFGKIKALAKGR